MARTAVPLIPAMLDGTAAVIHIATPMEADVVPMEAIAPKEISVATTALTIRPSSVTKNPEPSITLKPIPVYEYYYFTVTWYYWSYYSYYYTINTDLRTSLLSTHITTTTKLSVYETNSAAASSSFKKLPATLSFPTPAAAMLPTQTLSSEPDEPSSSSSTSSTTSTRSVASGSSSTSSATSSPISVTNSGAAGMHKEGYLWSLMGFTICCSLAATSTLWLL
ncbi:hypothetical protein DSL72_008498 [Monilinia vaccinii-corymbosi]|uniref:Uncharacterized protein n=1 Tax=Monilinia vaccinii-corymbosi TaxID=61207 RepID=A0A8A3PJY1_9HELO|nr:hypothetical protein DSL72_008498 [Monilinia vaccinii-corymbosi]